MVSKPRYVLSKQRMAQLKKHLPYTSLGERQAMHVLNNLGHTYDEIAACLGCSTRTISRVLAQFQQTASFDCKPISGSPKKMNQEKEQQLLISQRRTGKGTPQS
jgi:transposase